MTMKNAYKVLFHLSLIGGLSALSGTAEAQYRPSYDYEDSYDRDHRGPVLDRNHDGLISRQEYRRYHRRTAKKLAYRLDCDHNGWLDRAELRQDPRRGRRRRKGLSVDAYIARELHHAERKFARLDRNADRVLTRRELRGSRHEPEYGYSKRRRRGNERPRYLNKIKRSIKYAIHN